MDVYDQISWNKRKSALIISLFLILIIMFGYLIGAYFRSLWFGGILAAVIAFFYTLISWNFGSRMILATTSSKEITKKEYPFVFHITEAIAIGANIPMPKLYVIEDTAINAFATGIKPEKASITLTTGAIDRLKREELEGVIAHEMAHIKNYDIRVTLLAATLAGVIVLLADIFLRSMIFGDRKSERSAGPLILIGLILAILAPIIVEIIKLAVSRQREFLADATGAHTTKYPPGLAAALKKIRDDHEPLVEAANRGVAHLFIENPLRHARKKGFTIRTLLATHPDINERIRRLEQM